jgi:penicillin-binding protein 1A
MADDSDRSPGGVAAPPAPIPFPGPEGSPPVPPGGPRRRTRIRKLRVALLLFGLAVLAAISTVFGMMMAVASDLPALENRQEYKDARNSIIVDVRGHRLGVLTGNQNRIILRSDQIAPVMKSAIIAVEDRRFFTNAGVDVRGIARAFVADLTHKGAVQGGSTITQQFVKNALSAQRKRTLFEKLREAALAYHLTRKWSKEKILTEYLNAIYFGNGAYGVESAARTYFGREPGHEGCGSVDRPCAAELKPWEAALLAGVVSNPSAYDPLSNPPAATARRNLVLRDMWEQGRLTRGEYRLSVQQALPGNIVPPREETLEPYFTTWIKQQVVDRFGAGEAFGGGLTIHTTLDRDLQQAARQAISQRLTGVGPSASMVVIDNRTGEVRAMVGGADYRSQPFNLATQGQRQPGSAFKPFVLARALQVGISPNSLWTSAKRTYTVPGTHGREHFTVNNYEDRYAGLTTLAQATAYSDNSVFAQVGIRVGTRRIARLARRMGIRTPVSHNWAISLGGLKHGVTPLDMAHAYETFAHHGELVTGSLGAPGNGPVGIHEVDVPGGRKVRNEVHTRQVLPRNVADETTSLLESVLRYGTGRSAAIPGFAAGKTGTTENYGDAWFVGFNARYTVAVWVGYPDRLKPMRTEFAGKPVAGGTYPALIWHDFMIAAMNIDKARAAERALKEGRKTSTTTTPTVPSPSDAVPPPTTPKPAPNGGQEGPPATDRKQQKTTTTPATPAPQAPAPTGDGQPQAPPTGGASPPSAGAQPGTAQPAAPAAPGA